MVKKIMHILDGRAKKITETETVLQPLPHKDFRFASPFIVLHHIVPENIAPGSLRRIHPHPHRGFSPVTILLRGEGFHKDNHGGEGILAAGDAQWMFAGSGLLHSEGPTDNLLKNGGEYELIQLWINTPAKNKWEPPTYQLASKAEQPKIPTAEGASLRLIAGDYEDLRGPLLSHTPVTIIRGKLHAGKGLQLLAKPGYWTLLYLISGKLLINGENILPHQLVVFEKENDELLIRSCEDSHFLYLSGEPIEEPVAAGGNFVMNSSEELQQAEADYKAGKFGTLDF